MSYLHHSLNFLLTAGTYLESDHRNVQRRRGRWHRQCTNQASRDQCHHCRPSACSLTTRETPPTGCACSRPFSTCSWRDFWYCSKPRVEANTTMIQTQVLLIITYSINTVTKYERFSFSVLTLLGAILPVKSRPRYDLQCIWRRSTIRNLQF